MLYAVGIPLAFFWLLFKYKVPSLAKHKRECHTLSKVIVEYIRLALILDNEEHALHIARCAIVMI